MIISDHLFVIVFCALVVSWTALSVGHVFVWPLFFVPCRFQV